MGGAGFPTTRKIRKVLQHTPAKVIANGVESDPGVTADQFLLENCFEDVAEGIAIVCRILAIDQSDIAVSAAQVPDLEQSQFGVRITVRRVTDPFRTGEERELIREVLGDVVGADSYPSDHGILILNIATLFAICEAVRDGRRPRDRLVTVAGENQWVEINKPVSELIDWPGSIRLGGPATGHPESSDATIGLTTNAISRDTSGEALPCIQCGSCTDVCPRKLPVEKMALAFSGTRTYEDIDDSWEICNECGACVTACPSRIHILDGIRRMRQQSQQDHNANVRQTVALARYERKQRRVEQEAHTAREDRDARLSKPHSWT